MPNDPVLHQNNGDEINYSDKYDEKHRNASISQPTKEKSALPTKKNCINTILS